MKRNLIYILPFFLLSITGSAQVTTEIKNSYKKIVKLIQEDKAAELAALVSYPLKRDNPLPDITNAKEFIAGFPVLFDAAFKKKLLKYNASYIFERNGVYGLIGGPFSGEIWIREDGKMITLNYSSEKETAIKEQLIKKKKSQVHPSIAKWEENLYICRSEKLLVRIDRTSKGIRYVSWSKGHQMSDQPDLILYNGIEENQGTMGGWTYTFHNGNWTYVFDDVQMCEKPSGCGLFLSLLLKEEEKGTYKMTAVK
ncbi:hypothetical protein [Flavobacterium sp.]|uniref:hypothetical protein n=1 Tax=Flavobacterium sp. TaxID=239 RepID=UPI003D6B3804